MKYRLADTINGPFGEVFADLEKAEKALAEEIASGNKLNAEFENGADASDFFCIVNAETGDAI